MILFWQIDEVVLIVPNHHAATMIKVPYTTFPCNESALLSKKLIEIQCYWDIWQLKNVGWKQKQI